MKTNGLRGMLALFLLLSGMALYGQDRRVEVPGDHFSLEGALELFKKSSSPEEFERLLNAPDGKVNNLDLNGDSQTDYIRVIDRNEGSVHAFILQAVISDTESQDVAVIELEKLANGKAVLQITGDADVYGMETIIEPTEEVRINAGSSTGRAVVNVWTWPSVQYIYGPYYSSWVSPWRWSYYPGWYRPWRPVAYYVYNPWWEPYRPYYSVCYTHRSYAPRIYRPYRTTSVTVYHRHHAQLTSYRSSRRAQGYTWDRNHDNRSNNDRQDYRNSGNDSREKRKYGSPQSGGSGASGQDWRRQPRKDEVNRGASGNGSPYTSKDRSGSDWRRKPLTLQQGDASRKWTGTRDQNQGSRQRITRPVNERKEIQRSSGTQINRGGSGGNNNSIQRSGNRGNGTKSIERKRGRE